MAARSDRTSARGVSPFAIPLASVSRSGSLYDVGKAELRTQAPARKGPGLEERLERLCSQHSGSEYNLARRRSLQTSRGSVASTPVTLRRSTGFTPASSRSSHTSIIVESPPQAIHGPLTTSSRSHTPVYEDGENEEATTPTAKRRWEDWDEDGRRTPVPSDRGSSAVREMDLMMSPMREPEMDLLSPTREMPFPMDMAPSTPADLPPGTKTSLTHPLNLSAIVPPELLDLFGFFLLGPPPQPEEEAVTMPLPHFAPSSPPRRGTRSPVSSLRSSSAPSSAPKEFRVLKPVEEAFHLVQHARHPGHGPIDLWHMTKSMNGDVHNPWTMPLASTTLALAAVQQPPNEGGPGPIGNLLLSSCPGKKVRLCSTVPRGGRTAICRDLGVDLQAAKDAGVRAIVCCLDNDELALLGAPWHEYYRITQEMGLPVYRLPMEEGMAPIGGASVLDATLEIVLARHTLRGETILAHCRGGIGRAGLFACAWALKMQIVSATPLLPALTLVERVIDVIRRRRSVKAIETAAQVKALLDYVQYLRHQTTAARAEEVLASERF